MHNIIGQVTCGSQVKPCKHLALSPCLQPTQRVSTLTILVVWMSIYLSELAPLVLVTRRAYFYRISGRQRCSHGGECAENKELELHCRNGTV